jgi:hypothetical protein
MNEINLMLQRKIIIILSLCYAWTILAKNY